MVKTPSKGRHLGRTKTRVLIKSRQKDQYLRSNISIESKDEDKPKS